MKKRQWGAHGQAEPVTVIMREGRECTMSAPAIPCLTLKIDLNFRARRVLNGSLYYHQRQLEVAFFRQISPNFIEVAHILLEYCNLRVALIKIVEGMQNSLGSPRIV